MSAIVTKPRKVETVGFGCPVVEGVARFAVEIPAGRDPKAKVRVREDEGYGFWQNRVVLRRDAWDIVAAPIAEEMNRRLASAKPKLKAGRWRTGETLVERQLGLELLCLAYAIEDEAQPEVMTAAVNWMALTPEERRWLALRASASDGRTGWREAIGIALTDRRPQT